MYARIHHHARTTGRASSSSEGSGITRPFQALWLAAGCWLLGAGAERMHAHNMLVPRCAVVGLGSITSIRYREVGRPGRLASGASPTCRYRAVPGAARSPAHLAWQLETHTISWRAGRGGGYRSLDWLAVAFARQLTTNSYPVDWRRSVTVTRSGCTVARPVAKHAWLYTSPMPSPPSWLSLPEQRLAAHESGGSHLAQLAQL